MAIFTLTNAYISINSVNLSSYATSLSANFEIDEQDATAFSSGAAETVLPGISKGTVDLEFLQDFANSASATDQALWGVWNGKAPVACEIRPVNTTVSTSNPKYTFNAYIFKYPPIDGQVGQTAKTKVSLRISGAAPARATS